MKTGYLQQLFQATNIRFSFKAFSKINYPRSFEKANAIPSESMYKMELYFAGMALALSCQHLNPVFILLRYRLKAK